MQATPRKNQKLHSLKKTEGTIANCLVFPSFLPHPTHLCPGCEGAPALSRAGRSLRRDPRSSSGEDGHPPGAGCERAERFRSLACNQNPYVNLTTHALGALQARDVHRRQQAWPGFQHAGLPNISCRRTPQLDSRIKTTFKRCWIGAGSNFSLTTNVNSYQRQSNSIPADAVHVRVFSCFKHRCRIAMGARLRSKNP